MKLGIILTTMDSEETWNAFRFASESVHRGHEVKVFLMGEAVDVEEMRQGRFNIPEQISDFIASGGEILLRGSISTNLKVKTSDTGAHSAMGKCIDVVEWADKIISF